MSLNTHDTYEKIDNIVKVNSNISYDVIYKEFSRYEDCVEYLNTVYNGHGNIVSTFNDRVVSVHSSTHSDLPKVYCSDFRLVYDIYGILGEGYVISEESY